MSIAPTLAVIGAGSLARALLSGWATRPGTFSDVTTVSQRRTRAAELASSATRALSVEDDPDAASHAMVGADIVLVAVKPWMVSDVLPKIAPKVEESGVTVVSVMAGVRLRTLRRALPAAAGIVRVLPNTPTQVLRGVTGLSADAPADRVIQIDQLFSTLGEVVHVDEDRLDALTVLSGSTPAFYFYLVEKLASVIGTHGFSDDTAVTLARQVFLGSAALLDRTGDDATELRRRVTSPNGVTHHALQIFEEANFEDLLSRAMTAGLTRAKELAVDAEGRS